MANEELENDTMQPAINEGSSNNPLQKENEKVGKALQDKLKKDAGKKAAVKGKLAAAMGPVIFWASVAIVAIIIIIGIIMFFETMPGMVMEKLKALGKSIAKAWNSWWGSDDTQQVDNTQIYQALDYLHEMEYDLKGYGFLTKYVDGEESGVKRDDNGKITEAYSDYIKTYLASDNYVYTIKNHNLVTDSGWTAFWRHTVDFFGGSFGEKLTRGLIAVYKEGSKGTGDRGGYYSDTGLFNYDKMILNVEERTLSLKKGHNSTVKYDLDGWTGRYGMPIDFLMSIHFATLMPDLAYDMATHFDTEVILILKTISNSNVVSAFKSGNNYITYDDLQAVADKHSRNLWEWLGGASEFSDEEVQEVLSTTGITVPDGENARDYLQKILEALRKRADDDFEYYVPYIESVQNHWYRNVYYAINSKNTKSGSGKADFVKYDYDYESMMRERWTLYETDDNNNVKLYALNSDGNYATSESEIENYSEEVFVKDGDYYLFKGSEAEQKAILNGEAEGTRYNIAKKAITLTASNSDSTSEDLEDLGWNYNNGIWSVYKDGGETSSAWEQLFPDSSSEIEKNIYAKIKSASSINQTGEGQRSETNPDIKKMFLSNTYFKYDGTEQRAEAITKLRSDNGIAYGPLSESDLDKTVTVNGTVYSARDLSGQVTLNQDSLNAFDMLENIHTLDSDYIYRDFKELVVELGYFEKEEITDETPKLLEWLVPKIGSCGFPDRTIDKRESEYGTMIHSKGDIAANKKYMLVETDDESLADGEDDGDSQGDQQETDPSTAKAQEVQTIDPSSSSAHETSQGVEIGNSSQGETQSEDQVSQNETNVAYSPRTRAGLSLGASPSAGKTYTIDKSLTGDGYSYGVTLHGVTYLNYKQGQGSYASLPFSQGTYSSSACGPTSCAILSSAYGSTNGPKVFGDYLKSAPSLSGIKEVLEKKESIKGEAYTIGTSSSNTLTDSARQLAQKMEEALNEGKPVIVLVGNSNATSQQYTSGGHYFVFIGIDDDGTPIYCNTCSDNHEYTHRGDFSGGSLIEEFVYYYMQHSGKSNRGIYIPDEAPSGLKKAGDPYVGYEGNEGVVTPVTGVLLEYGTYKDTDIDSVTNQQYRVNVDLKYGPINAEGLSEDEFTPKIVSDKVGYAKILVLDAENYLKLEKAIKDKTYIKSEIDSKHGGSLVTEQGVFEDLDSLEVSDKEKLEKELKDHWKDYDKTLYGYKEFAEMYTKYGISGYVVFIDGFVCELPDEDLSDSSDISKEKPSGEELTMDSFKKMKASNIDLSSDDKLDSLYVADNKYVTASKKATNKMYAERKMKESAASSVYLESDDIILLKEGTVIGRTMTDMELLEGGKIRDSAEYTVTYNEARPSKDSSNTDKTKKDLVIGNYIRIIMRDLDTTPVEDVEDYMKLDDGTKKMKIQDDYDVHDPAFFVTLEQFKVMFAKYENILANAEAFIQMQETYQVNACFAAAVTITESGGGKGWDLIDPSTYNWFSIKGSYGGGYKDRNGTSWCKFSSFAEAVDYFGQLISKEGGHYYGQGKYWVKKDIAPVYCNESWGEKTVDHMNTAYEKIM